jgi:tetratricopeptide (TPR) repeat protein
MRVAAAVLIGFAVVVGLLATFRVIPGKRLGAHGPAPNAIEDHAKTFDEELAVAEQLIAGGNSAGATEHLGIASGLVPNLAADYVRLGKALLKVGDREKAFSSLKAAVEIDPDNREGWQALGDAQLGLGLYSEAVESYRHLIEGQPREGPLGELQHSFWLKYADALRMSGRSEEANLAFDRVYGTRDQKNSNASSAAHATIQKEKRAESSYVPMPRFQEMHGPTSPVNTARIEAPARVTNSPSPAPVVVPRRANERNPDDLFSEGIKILNGRDPRSLQRAELVRALELFQFASQGGAHRAEANRYADRLGREFDRRKKW